jgi:hypothetical protein
VLVIGGCNHPLLENDWDPEGSSLTVASTSRRPRRETDTRWSDSGFAQRCVEPRQGRPP